MLPVLISISWGHYPDCAGPGFESHNANQV